VNIEMNNFVGNILKHKFYACCYVLLSGTRSLNRYTHSYCGATMLL